MNIMYTIVHKLFPIPMLSKSLIDLIRIRPKLSIPLNIKEAHMEKR